MLPNYIYACDSMCHMMEINDNSSTARSLNFVPRIVEAGLAGNRQRLEILALSVIRVLREEAPTVADELASLLARFTANSGAVRWSLAEPPPADPDGGLSLLKVTQVDDATEPILPAAVSADVGRFLRQRAQIDRLLKEGIAPPRTLLLKGAPGTGKTMLARWLARNLGLPFVVLDLATSISSYLGKTGANLRRSLDYAKAAPCVILLDEFDAIGKRRDDATEVGELKRIVNVLLKEMEDWPFHSVLVAATNHPELLDPAVQRRFDTVVTLPLPGTAEREKILSTVCGRFAAELPAGFLPAMANATEGVTGSELTTLVEDVTRRHIIDQLPLAQGFVESIVRRAEGGTNREIGALIRALKQAADLSVREIAQLIGKGSSTVQYHLRKASA